MMQKGANAAWDNGHFLKQITLIQIVERIKHSIYLK